MIKQELCHLLSTKLEKLYNIQEINNLANYFEIELRKQQIYGISEFEANERGGWITDWIERLKTGEPIQYISGSAPFLDLELKITNQVLIPRSETEELARKIFIDNKEKDKLKILDIGSGSGCISLYLKNMKANWDVQGIDISSAAIECSEENSKHLGINVKYHQGDFLNENVTIDSGWDIIVSNPPYISKSEKQYMDQNVIKFEPDAALFVDDGNPLIFYKRIAEYGIKHLVETGLIYLELNEFRAHETLLLFQEMHYSKCILLNDYLDKPRFLKCIK